MGPLVRTPITDLQGPHGRSLLRRSHSDGRRAVTGARDGTVRVWDNATGECLLIIDAHSYHVQHLTWNPNESFVLSCSMHIRLWDITTGRCVREFPGHSNTIRNVQFSPDGKRIVSASHDKTVAIWDVASGEQVKSLRGHKGLVINAASRRDGGVISCDEDAGICVWPSV
jgi:WD40 repeat protein